MSTQKPATPASMTDSHPALSSEVIPSPIDNHVTESRLVILDRSGSGQVAIMRMDNENGISGIDHTTDVEYTTWPQIQGLKDFCAVVVNNNLHLIGGYNIESKICSMRMRRYSPDENTWEEMPTMCIGRIHSACCSSADRYIFVIGGEKQDGKPTRSCEVFDIHERKWTKGGVMPSARKLQACAAGDTHIFVSGGHSGKKAHRNLWIYEQSSWHELDDDYPTGISQNLERHCMVYYDHTLYFIGGITYERRTVPLHNPKTDTPARSTAKIIPHVQNKVESFKFHVRSGENQELDEDELLDDLISPWDWRLPPMSCPRHSAGCVVFDRKIYMVGGTDPGGKVVRDVECFNLDDQTWTTSFRLPKGNYQNVACVLLQYKKPLVSLPKVAINSKPHLTAQEQNNRADKYSKMKWILW